MMGLICIPTFLQGQILVPAALGFRHFPQVTVLDGAHPLAVQAAVTEERWL